MAENNRFFEKYRTASCIAILLWLAGWYIKLLFYKPYLLETTKNFPVAHPLFPALFQNPDVAAFFYFLPLTVLPLLFFPYRFFLKVSSVILVLSAAVLNIHINTCNDATFVTSFWVGLWLLWFAFTRHWGMGSFLHHAKRLSLCIVGMIFFGGFVGKLTPEYFSGDVMFKILMQGGEATLTQILMVFPEAQRPAVAMWLSRTTIGTEFILALSPFFPTRMVLIILGVVFFGFCLFSTWTIFSVLACLIGMVWASDYLPRERL